MCHCVTIPPPPEYATKTRNIPLELSGLSGYICIRFCVQILHNGDFRALGHYKSFTTWLLKVVSHLELRTLNIFPQFSQFYCEFSAYPDVNKYLEEMRNLKIETTLLNN